MLLRARAAPPAAGGPAASTSRATTHGACTAAAAAPSSPASSRSRQRPDASLRRRTAAATPARGPSRRGAPSPQPAASRGPRPPAAAGDSWEPPDGGPRVGGGDTALLVGVAGALTLVTTAALTLGPSWLDDDAALSAGATAGATTGDVVGALLWGVGLFFASPLQVLLLFLGKIETERPSDWTLRVAGRAAGLDVDAVDYEAPGPLRHVPHVPHVPHVAHVAAHVAHVTLRIALHGPLLAVDVCCVRARAARSAANAAAFGAAGVAVAAGLSAALGGEATWSVSTGIGFCLAAGVYELGRPARLSAAQSVALEARYALFCAFAEARLDRRGRCHVSEVERAIRDYYPQYRRPPAEPSGARARRVAGLPAAPEGAGGAGAEEAAFDARELKTMIANWAPAAEGSSAGFYKGLSVRAAEAGATTDPFTGQPR